MHPKVKELLDRHDEEQDKEMVEVQAKLIEMAKPALPEWAHEFLIVRLFFGKTPFVYLEIPDCAPICITQKNSLTQFWVESSGYLPIVISDFEEAVVRAVKAYPAFIQAQSQSPSAS